MDASTEKHYRALELDKILDRLAGQTSCPDAADGNPRSACVLRVWPRGRAPCAAIFSDYLLPYVPSVENTVSFTVL